MWKTPFTGKVSKYAMDRQKVDFDRLRREKERIRTLENQSVKREQVAIEKEKKSA